MGQALALCIPGVVTCWKLSDQEFKVIFNQYIVSPCQLGIEEFLYQKKRKKRRKGRKN